MDYSIVRARSRCPTRGRSDETLDRLMIEVGRVPAKTSAGADGKTKGRAAGGVAKR